MRVRPGMALLAAALMAPTLGVVHGPARAPRLVALPAATPVSCGSVRTPDKAPRVVAKPTATCGSSGTRLVATLRSTSDPVGGPDFFVTSAELGSWHYCDQYFNAIYAAFPLGVCGDIHTNVAVPDLTQGHESFNVTDACGVGQYGWSTSPGTYWSFPSAGTYGWMALPLTRVNPNACMGMWTVEHTFTLFVNGQTQGGTITQQWEVRPGQPSFSVFAAQMYGGQSPNSSTQSDPVDSLTGAYMDAETDARVAARGGGLAQTRSYTSADSTVGELGRGWTYGYEDSLAVDSQTSDVTVHTGTGQQMKFTHNADGSYTAAPGLRDSLVRNANGTYTRTNKAYIRSTYDTSGRLTQRRDRNNQGPTLTYGADGRLATVSSSGRSLTFTHDATTGRLTRVTLPDARYVAYTYNAAGLLETVRGTDGQTTTYGYDAGNRLSSIRDPNLNYPMRTTYDAATGRVTDQYDARDKHTTFAWDPVAQTQTMTDPRGKVWKDVYAGSFLQKRIDPEGGTTRYGWDDSGNLVAVTTPTGQTTTFEYDWLGNLTKRTGPRIPNPNNNDWGDYETFQYNSLNDVTYVRDLNAHDTYYFYDAAGNPTRVESPWGTVRGQTAWNADGTVLSTTNARNKTTTFEYTTAGDRSKATDPAGRVTTFFYDAVGRLTSTVAPRGNVVGANPDTYRTRYTFDDGDRPRTTTDPLNNVSETQYDVGGRVSKTIDARLKQTTYTYDAAGHVLTVQGPDLTVPSMRYTYDDNGNVATVTDHRNNVYTYTYDGANRQTQVSGPAGVWQQTYDLDGQTKTLVAPSGRTTTFTYTPSGMVSTIAYSDATPQVSFTYDAKGDRLSMTDGLGTANYAYDYYNRLTSVTRGSDVTTYTYDEDGDVLTRTLPGQTADTYTYDNADRLSTLVRGTATLASYAYDDVLGKRTATFANGTVQTLTADTAGRLAEIKTTSGASTLTRSALTYDANGNPVTIRNAADSPVTYTYDDLNRLTAACYATTTCTGATDFVKYTYDGNNNRLTEQRPTGTTTWTYNTANRPATRSGLNGSATYSYDADGNLLTDGTTTMTWNASRLPLTAKVGSKTTTYTYDGDGRRRSATKGNVVTQFVWDQQTGDLGLERDGAGAVQRRYTYALGLVGYTTGGADYYDATDQLGSVKAITSSTGAVQWNYEYEPYGRTKSSSSSSRNAPVNMLQFTGGYNDGTDYQLGARAYNANDGVFRSSDPVWQQSPGTGYGYANANPMVFTDPTGLDWVDTLHGISGWVAGGATVVSVVCPICAPVSGPIAAGALLVNAGTGFVQAYRAFNKGAYALAAFDAAMSLAAGYFGVQGVSSMFAVEGDAVPAIKPGSSGGPTAGQRFSQSVRDAALEENPGTCVYCHMETDAPQVDHAIPRAQGGNATLDNAQTTCGWCNASKGARPFPVNPPPGYEGPWPPPWWMIGS